MFFVLLLGYTAGKTRLFNADQASGVGKVALSFALPAALFVGMSALPRSLFAAQLKLTLCLITVHVGLFLLAHLFLRLVLHFETARSLVFSLIPVTSAAPIFGAAILSPLLGSTTIAAAGLVALAMNLVVPIAITLFEIDAVKKPGNHKKPDDQASPSTPQVPAKNPVVAGITAGLKSPLLWVPILGDAVPLSGIHLSTIISGSLNLIGSETAGMAIFVVGITLSSTRLVFSKSVILGTEGRISFQALCLFALAHLLHIGGLIYRDALVCCTFPLAAVVNLIAAQYKSAEAEATSVLFRSTVMMAATLLFMLYIGR